MSNRGVEWLAQRVVQLRTERELSRADLAAASGLDLDALAAVEEATVSASLRTLRALAKGFEIQLSVLCKGMGGPSDDERSIGVRVRVCRRAQNKSLEELAAKAGLTSEELAAIESDQVRPDLAVLRALAAALGKPVGDLLGEK